MSLNLVHAIQHPLLKLSRLSLSLHNLNKLCEKHCGISLVQWSILKHLIDLPGTSAIELAKSAGVHRSTLTSTLQRLEKKSFIFIDKNHQDARKKIILITRLGKEKLETIETLLQNELENSTGTQCELFSLESLISIIGNTGQALIKNQTAVSTGHRQSLFLKATKCQM